jgi:hypothetical protein
MKILQQLPKTAKRLFWYQKKYILPGTITIKYSHHLVGDQGYNVVRLACFKK